MLPRKRASIDERTAALPVIPPVLPLAMPHPSRPLAVLRDHSRYAPGRFQAFPLSMPACTMRGSHIVGRCACTWPPPERDFSSSCSCGLFFNAVSTGAGERSRQNARACTENASNGFWREARAFVWDDSFEHEAIYERVTDDADAPARYVLYMALWHPDLGEVVPAIS